LIAQVLECESDHFALWHACNAEVEPSLVMVVLRHVRVGVTSYPDIEAAFAVSPLGPRHVSTAKLAAEDNI